MIGESAIAGRAVEALLGKMEGGPGPADWLLAAQLGRADPGAGQTGGIPRESGGRSEVDGAPGFQASLFQLAATRADAPGARETQAPAWTRITKIARGKTDVALDALTVLAQHALSSPNEIVADPAIMPNAEVIQALQAHPLAKAAQKLLAVDLQMHLAPDQRETLIAQAAQTWKTADNESLAILARWLNGKGEFQRELDTIPLDRALQTRDLFLQRLDALGAMNNWAEIKRLLLNETFPLDPVIEFMYLARCNQQLGEVMAGENNWRRALEAAAGDPQKLLTLADYAEKNGAIGIADTAYNTIARENPGVRAAQQGRLRLAQQKRDTRLIHSILAEMLKQWPNDTAVQNDEAYLRLLLAGGGKAEKLKTETLNGAVGPRESTKPKGHSGQEIKLDGGTRAVASGAWKQGRHSGRPSSNQQPGTDNRRTTCGATCSTRACLPAPPHACSRWRG